ncbi:hypothetical protein I302_106867 [Kwoniella bestiolae CBS 10118]|uniref:RNase III domain-containing protein n=1 Tax=Kwoniella bestiolae CBS 10118 TaxID=1296100 RepID=A0A1B9G064_9TREE|nr:hypothetical protein I302_05867 [Kwoniella bestiolae CBS 10118]OCF24407.1 hypothetical protein I302_05867 [Kwoniella bestiolae CBS 10118]
MRYNTEDHNNPLFSFILPPLTPLNEPLPPLPRIIDPDLYQQVISHVSLQCLTRRSVMALAKPEEEYEKAVDYEKLEHLGDAILENVATGLIQEMFPWLRQGGAAIIRDYLVSNSTLAQLSVFYILPLLIKADASSIIHVRSSEKIQASVLEAWIAGAWYSFLRFGEGGGIVIDEEGEVSICQTETALGEVKYVGNVDQGEDELIKASEEAEGQGEEGEDEESMPKGLQPVLEPVKCLKLDDSSKVEDGTKKVSHTADLADLISMMMSASTTTSVITTTTTSSTQITVTPGRSAKHPDSQGTDSGSNATTEDPNSRPAPLLTMEPSQNPSSIQTRPPSGPRTKGQAFDYVESWLSPLLKPYCQWIYSILLEEQNKILSSLPPDVPKLVIPEHWKDEDRKSMGMPQALSQHPWIKSVGSKPVYEKEPKTGQRWRVVCRVVDLDGKEWVGEAIRPNVQAAKNVAAWMVYRQLGQ